MKTGLLRSMRTIAASCVLSVLAAANPAAAQEYPSRPVTIIVPYAAGILGDLFTRALADGLTTALKQTVIVDNKPGAAQIVGSTALNQAAPDGYTLMLSVMPNIIPPSLQSKVSFGGNTNFATVAEIAELTSILAVSPGVKANSLKEFIDLAKASPGKYLFGSAGTGSPNHLQVELINNAAGIKGTHVPYRSIQNVLTDLMADQVQYALLPYSASQFADQGKLKVLGATRMERDPDYSKIPTLDEAGLKGFEQTIHYFIVAPKNTPPALIEKLNEQINKVTAAPSYLAKIKTVGGVRVPPARKAAQSAEILAREDSKYSKMVKDLGIAIE